MHLVPAKWSSYEVINAVVNNSILQGGQLAYLVVKLHENVNQNMLISLTGGQYRGEMKYTIETYTEFSELIVYKNHQSSMHHFVEYIRNPNKKLLLFVRDIFSLLPCVSM